MERVSRLRRLTTTHTAACGHHRPTNDPTGSLSVYDPRGLRPLGIPPLRLGCASPTLFPRAPGLACVLRSRAGLTPSTAAPTPIPRWLAMSTAPRRHASAGIAPALCAVTIPAWPRTTFRCVAGEPTLSASSTLRVSPHPVQCAASATGTEAAKRSQHDKRCQRSRQLLRQWLRLITRADLVHNADGPSPLPKAMNRASKLTRFMLTPSRAQPGSAMTTVVARALKTPDRHTGCGETGQPVRRSPMRCGFATSTLRHAEAWQAPVVPCRRNGGPMRHTHRVNACRRLASSRHSPSGDGGCAGSPR